MKQSRQIFITAGHRGGSSGANANGYSEAELAIKLRDALTDQLSQKGIVAINDEDKDTLSDVVAKINKTCNDRDICIDIHFNSFSSQSAQGTEVLIQNYPSNTEMELAEDLLVTICKTLGTKNRGVKKEGQSQYKRLAMLSNVKCNSVLIEVCFISSTNDMKRYLNSFNVLVYNLVNDIIKYVTQ